MRIISGQFKGKKLQMPKTESIRPTADMVKEAMFTKLYDKVLDACFLDLFAGSGSVGIEAMSRGANQVVFVDKDFYAVNLIKENLQNLNDNYKICKSDFKNFLSKEKQKFDLIFIDPPYKSEFYIPALKLIFENDLLSKDGIIICEHNKDSSINQNYFELFDVKNYGIKSLSYFQNSTIK